jgi:type IV fimbrial biogenesis protein FimT
MQYRPIFAAGTRLYGYTLLELVVTMVVLIVLTLIAAPTFDGWQARQRMNAALHALQQDLLTARSQAIALGANVVACPGDVVSGCSVNSDWSRGWLVFLDMDGDRDFGDGETLIRSTPAPRHLTVMSAASRPNLRFYPNGTAPGSNGSIWFCGTRGPDHAQRLVLSNVGRIRREPYDGLEWEDCPES